MVLIGLALSLAPHFRHLTYPAHLSARPINFLRMPKMTQLLLTTKREPNYEQSLHNLALSSSAKS